MWYETDNESDFWGYFNTVKDDLSYFERDKMIDDYYGEITEFKNQYFIIIKCKEFKNELVKIKYKNIKMRNKKIELNGIEYDFDYLLGSESENYHKVSFKENMDDFLNIMKCGFDGKLKYEIFNPNIIKNEKFHHFFKSDISDIQIQKVETNIRFETYFGIVIGSKNYIIINEGGKK